MPINRVPIELSTPSGVTFDHTSTTRRLALVDDAELAAVEATNATVERLRASLARAEDQLAASTAALERFSGLHALVCTRQRDLIAAAARIAPLLHDLVGDPERERLLSPALLAAVDVLDAAFQQATSPLPTATPVSAESSPRGGPD